MVRFMKLTRNGVTEEREISREDLLKCPHYILVEEHYRKDGSCRCNDSMHFEMAEWGYMWNGEQWVSTPEEDE